MTTFNVITLNKKTEKMMIKLIVAVGENNVIGNKGRIPWHIPDDLKYFKTITRNSCVVMGKKTYQSIGHPLMDRINFVVSSGGPIPGCIVVDDPKKILELKMEDLFVIGGQQIYEYFLPMADMLYVTHVYGEFPGDSFFPDIDLTKWEEVSYEDGNCGVDDEKKWGFSIYMRKKY